MHHGIATAITSQFLHRLVRSEGISAARRKLGGNFGPKKNLGCGFFAYSWKLPAYSGAFLLTVDNFSFSAYNFSFFAYSFCFFTYSWSFFAYSGKVRLIRALRDCKQRSLTVSKKAPTVSEKASPEKKIFSRRHPPSWQTSSRHLCNPRPSPPHQIPPPSTFK